MSNKRAYLAQRKFAQAQGLPVPLPPNNEGSTSNKSSKRNGEINYLGQNAVNLLDLISFQGLHKHSNTQSPQLRQLFVLLEKLPNTEAVKVPSLVSTPVPKPESITVPEIVNSVQEEPKKTPVKSTSSPITAKKKKVLISMTKIKQLISKKKFTMSLRSRNESKPTVASTYKKPKAKLRKIALRPRAMKKNIPEFSSDDETPLRIYKTPPTLPKPKTSSSTENMKTRRMLRLAKDKNKGLPKVNRKLKGGITKNRVSKKTPIIMKSKSTTPKKPVENVKSKDFTLKVLTPDLEVLEINSTSDVKNEIQSEIIEPDDTSFMNLSTSTAVKAKKNMEASHSNTYYGNHSQIEQWLRQGMSSQNVASSEVTVTEEFRFKVPNNPVARITPSKPAESNKAIEDQQNCVSCQQLLPQTDMNTDGEALCISCLAKKTVAETANCDTMDDIYEFSCERDSSPMDQRPNFRNLRRSDGPSTAAAVTTNTNDGVATSEPAVVTTDASDTAVGKHLFYLDLFDSGSSEHVIEAIAVPTPGQNKPLISARLISRADMKDHPADTTMRNLTSDLSLLAQLLPGLQKETDQNKPTNILSFPKPSDIASMVTAPTFYPKNEELQDPLTYIESIKPDAEKFGLCKIVLPQDFKPDCHLPEGIRFVAQNQYPNRMYERWGPAMREFCAIKSQAAKHNVTFKQLPLIDGMELNLPKLYHVVQNMGGLSKVIGKKKWFRVAEELGLQKNPQLPNRLDKLYVKYLLPYDILNHRMRMDLFASVERDWDKKHKKMVSRAMSPMRRQKHILEDTSSTDSDEEEVESTVEDMDDCVVKGRSMTLEAFKKIAAKVQSIHFPNDPSPSTEEIERQYWRHVLVRNHHVCVNAASVDTGDQGYGFPNKIKSSPYAKHPWNLKVLSNNSGSVLRSLGKVLGVTMPTLHIGMVFTSACWYRDPHGLPWIEYLHTGAPKIWYGIPDEQSEKFRSAVEKLGPGFCQNKKIWLPSEIAMIPPELLTENNVSLCKAIQQPGEFIVIFPKAYTSSICTGYTVSESVYFGPTNWLMSIQQDFQDVRNSCEPTMFSLEQLLMSIASDARTSKPVILQVYTTLKTIIDDERTKRKALKMLKIECEADKSPSRNRKAIWNVREHSEECDLCRTILYLSKVTGLLDKNSKMCLKHALMLLEKKQSKRINIKEVSCIFFFSMDELDATLKKLETRLCLRSTN